MWLFGHRTRRSVLRCRDTARHRHRLEVQSHADAAGPRVILILDSDDPLVLMPLQVGWLRRKLRDSVLEAEQQCARLGKWSGTWA